MAQGEKHIIQKWSCHQVRKKPLSPLKYARIIIGIIENTPHSADIYASLPQTPQALGVKRKSLELYPS